HDRARGRRHAPAIASGGCRRVPRKADTGRRAHRRRGAFLDARRPEIPGCLVLDVRLPGLSGLDLQRELADTDRELPIIFLTGHGELDRKSTRLNSSHGSISYAVFFLKKMKVKLKRKNKKYKERHYS